PSRMLFASLLLAPCSLPRSLRPSIPLFFCKLPAPTEISSLSLHDALPISAFRLLSRRARDRRGLVRGRVRRVDGHVPVRPSPPRDRKSTRLNSSHVKISYAVFCLKKKKKKKTKQPPKEISAYDNIYISRHW